MKKFITSIQIDESDLTTINQSRNYTIKGDSGSVFYIQVQTSDNRWYNFSTKSFDSAGVYGPNNRLDDVEIVGSSYTGSITFPSDTDGETYTFFLRPSAHFNTELANNLVSKSLDSDNNLIETDYNKYLYTTVIQQKANVTVTLYLKSRDNANSYTTATKALNVTLTASPRATTPVTETFDFTIENTSSDANGFGLSKLKDLTVDDFFTLPTGRVNEPDRTGSTSHFNYVLDDISNVGVGMGIQTVGAGSITGAPKVIKARRYESSSEKAGKPFVKFTVAQSLADNTLITFKANGSQQIKNGSGMDISFEDLKFEIKEPTTTLVRGAISSSTSVTVSGTYGFGKSASDALEKSYIEGLSVDNTTDNPINEVVASSSAGTIITTTAQTLADDTVLTLVNMAKKWTVSGRVVIKQFPSSNTEVYLDLDTILIPGIQS